MTGTRIAVCRWAAIAILLWTAGAIWAQEHDSRTMDMFHGSFTNDVRRLFGEDRPELALLSYTQDRNIPMSNLVAVLGWFVDTGCGGEPRDETGWCTQAINVMGDLRRPECMPRLVEIAQHPPNRACQSSAFRAISRIGGHDALAFAATVLTDTNTFSFSDRLNLYDQTMRHAISGVLEYGTVGDPSDEERALTRQFFLQDPRSSEKLESALRYDEDLSATVTAYRTNAAREAFLAFFCTNAPAPFRQRFAERLATVPQREQTTVTTRNGEANLRETETLAVPPSVATGPNQMAISETNTAVSSSSLPSVTVSSQRRALFGVAVLFALGCSAGLAWWRMRSR